MFTVSDVQFNNILIKSIINILHQFFAETVNFIRNRRSKDDSNQIQRCNRHSLSFSNAFLCMQVLFGGKISACYIYYPNNTHIPVLHLSVCVLVDGQAVPPQAAFCDIDTVLVLVDHPQPLQLLQLPQDQ